MTNERDAARALAGCVAFACIASSACAQAPSEGARLQMIADLPAVEREKAEPRARPPVRPELVRLDSDTAAKIASENSPAVVAAATDLLVKAADLTAARLFWRPTLNLQSVYLYGRGESTSFPAVQLSTEPGVPTNFSKGDFLSNTFALALPLFSSGTWFGANTPAALAAAANQTVSQETLRQQASEASNLIVKAYFNAVLGLEQVAIYREEYALKRKALEVVRQRVLARESVLSDQLLVETAVAVALAGINTAEGLYRANLLQFRTLLGVPVAENVELAPVPDEIPALPPLADLIGKTIDEHPKIASQVASVQAARAAVLQAQGNYSPVLSFSSSYTLANNSAFQRGPTFSTIGVQLAVPISDFGQSNAKILSKQYALTQSEQQLLAVRSSLEQGIAAAGQSAIAAREQIPPAKARLEQLKFVEQSTRANYELGRVLLDKLIDDQYNVMNQRINLLTAKYLAWSAFANVVEAVGKTYSSQALASLR